MCYLAETGAPHQSQSFSCEVELTALIATHPVPSSSFVKGILGPGYRFWEMPIPQLNTESQLWRYSWRQAAYKVFAFNGGTCAAHVFKVARRLNFRQGSSASLLDNHTGGDMQTLWQDLRYGARMMMKKPGFSFG